MANPQWDEFIAGFINDPVDFAVIEDAIRAFGIPDGALGDRVAVSRVSLLQASRSPFIRTPLHGLDAEDVSYAKYLVSTLRVPSGRVFQIQRRYPSEEEVDRYLAEQVPQHDPALEVREITDVNESAGIAEIEAMTVVPDPAFHPEGPEVT